MDRLFDASRHSVHRFICANMRVHLGQRITCNACRWYTVMKYNRSLGGVQCAVVEPYRHRAWLVNHAQRVKYKCTMMPSTYPSVKLMTGVIS